MSASGFQETRNTGAEVTLYSHADDPFLGTRVPPSLRLDGRTNNHDQNPAVVSVTTNKVMGGAFGMWSVDVLAPDTWGRIFPSFLNSVLDDDWVDIVWTVNGRRTHHMRGQVDSIRMRESAGAGGAPERRYTISGRDFGRILTLTPIWFNNFKAENAAGQETIRIFDSLRIGGNPTQTVKRILGGFLETLTGKGRANWPLPRSMPNGGGNDFVRALRYSDVDFDPAPARISASTQFENPGGTPLWNMAQEWADPMFCELFTDLAPSNSLSKRLTEDGEFLDSVRAAVNNITSSTGGSAPKYLDPRGTSTPESTLMTVFFRNKPFPTVRKGMDSPWFSLPMLEVTKTAIVHKDVGRGGDERFNAFMVSPQVFQETARSDLTAPMWDTASIRRFGLRRFMVDSRYVADQANLGSMSQLQREDARDFYVLNPYLLNGSITLGALYPGLRVGMRLRITGEEESTQETYYVEQVSHSWNAGGPGRTTATVTRGWVGSDREHMATLQKAVSTFSHYP